MIRPETPADHDAVDEIHRAAFAGDERIVPLVHALRDAPANLPARGYVAGDSVGHVLLSASVIGPLYGARLPWLSVATTTGWLGKAAPANPSPGEVLNGRGFGYPVQRDPALEMMRIQREAQRQGAAPGR